MISPNHNELASLKVIGVALIVAFVLGFATLFFEGAFGSSFPSLAAAADSNLTSTTPSSANTGDAVSLINKIQTITLDSSIFSNQAFESLNDFTAPIQPTTVGRSNPFAPIAGVQPTK